MAAYRPLKIAGWCLIISLPALAQEPGQGLPTLVRGNNRFASKLLLQVHSAIPNRNVIVSAPSLTLVFAALQTGVPASASQEIGDTFGWGADSALRLPSKMFLAAFEKPAPSPPPLKNVKPTLNTFSRQPEAAWITTTVFYRGRDVFSDWFVRDAQKYFGMSFRSTGARRPALADLQGPDKPRNTLPKMSLQNDVLINSTLHLPSAWRGNTFSMSEAYQMGFSTSDGELKHVQTLRSEVSNYPYAKTDRFEAVALPCNRGYFLAILPATGKSVQDLERELAEAPDMVDRALANQLGSVAMPTFHFQFEAKLENAIQGLGIQSVFRDLGPIVKLPGGANLTEVAQKIDIQVDQAGIRASAETVIGAVYGGIGSGSRLKPFNMELNRPFVFLIRDGTTNAMLFSGAIEDPTQP